MGGKKRKQSVAPAIPDPAPKHTLEQCMFKVHKRELGQVVKLEVEVADSPEGSAGAAAVEPEGGAGAEQHEGGAGA